ncbi:DUF2768 family protein [Pontibacillus yanchengensis]|uniref:DUF2768 family protein n=2 Tax=Pontibacillus yanchengensis TaxID=462910 RepID=A0ACC7VKB6_9BACI|nr:DUF2768 domain-containing protein [Pontibacillus yanchengensis]MYL32738.1 DUF2768 family protein [Pontibacillus yanchengensis]MYL55132.1 DUF2768 family protein [Pontibacillus yanchengensis]
MSRGMLNMYISFAGIIFMFLAIGLILLSRYKLSGILSGITAFLAYIFLMLGGIIIFYIVFSGPTS